jgi:outer membrane murein-binding lipoprotein Lpp
MDAQRRSEITGWDAREFSDGFADLGRLVDRGFSGAVTDGAAWLFVFEGRVVGAVGGDIDDFADGSGTLYEAPEAVLPVLFAMQERGGEPRAQYYTNDTPLSEADRKLSQGGFTGYVELSENVLSGDYYVTYTAGESMAAAYVGNSRRLETGEKAFDLADDEVGIYTVYEVDLDVREILSDGDAGAAASGSGAAGTADDAEPDETAADGAEPSAAGLESGRTSDSDRVPDSGSEPDDAAPSGPTAADAGPGTAGDDPAPEVAGSDASDTSDERRESPGARAETDPEHDRQSPVDIGGSDDRDAEGRRRRASEASTDARSRTDESTTEPGEAGSETASGDRDAAVGGTDPDPSKDASDGSRPSDDVFSEEEQWREQKSIPALDPSEASDPQSGRNGAGNPGGSGSGRPGESNGTAQREEGGTAAEPANEQSPDPRSTAETGANRSAVSQRSRGAGESHEGSRSERLRELESALAESERERESLAAELDEVAGDRDDVEAERDELAAEVDRLESEVSTLRDERDRLRDELAAARERLPENDRSLSPAEARSGTNLFVRYDSKGGATLEDAHDGTVDRDMLRENLRIEHHTSFETDGLTVDGRSYEEFLRETIEYGFTRWLVEDLPFEVSGTGNQSVLRDLYDAIPEVDRAEIGGSVSIAIRENGEETREQRAFDLVLRDRMGNPLFVADLNDSRDPTAEGTLESLVSNGRDIAESNDSFAGAFAVTESFFEPGALETASDAVGGGLFSRSKRASFVKLSRKQGYHLCLVEARDGGFHMTVPDL